MQVWSIGGSPGVRLVADKDQSPCVLVEDESGVDARLSLEELKV